MTNTVLLRSRVTRKCQARFWRAAALVRESPTLIKQAARNIKHKAVIEYGLKLVKVRRDSAEPKQLTLFETPSTELTVPKRRKHDTRKGKRRVPGNLGRQKRHNGDIVKINLRF